MRALPLLLLVACGALAQDREVEIVWVPKAQLAALLQRLAALQAEKEKRDADDRAEKVRLGCT